MILKSYTFIVLALMVLVVRVTPVCAAQPEGSSENNIKAAYLFNFAKFVEWPEAVFETNRSAIRLTVLGDEPMADILKTLDNKTVTGRPLKIDRNQNPMDIKGVHILYIGESQMKNLKLLREMFGDKPVLMVSSAESFAGQGGMIGFIRKGNTIRFEVNLEAVRRSGLTISSRLLKLAVIVDDGKGEAGP